MNLYDEFNNKSLDQLKHSRDFKSNPLEVLSLGGGVQSTAMLLLISQYKLPKPDLILHCDTGSEMSYTEDIIQYCQHLSYQLKIPFKIITSKLGKLHEHYFSNNTLPVVGIRSCTFNFKILPQRRFLRQIVGKGNGKTLVNIWLGITTDESDRTHPSELQWIQNKFPLINLKYSRNDCININKSFNLDVKKSGCFCCPYGGKKWFIHLYQNHPDLFKICVEMELSYQEKHGNKHGLVPSIIDLSSLQIPSLLTFGSEYLTDQETSCDSGGCFL